ncbi:hypothetical protein C7S16_4229 [Burkholderia thailandensis]|uniref:Uncharacterized protein n=1 Tax=Burkholderia thailandensis TaxID=57975 RepID=A0AAW9CQB3_BURTH|nr:hypothetical protein [Burkholderia thailandensis]
MPQCKHEVNMTFLSRSRRSERRARCSGFIGEPGVQAA